jgi:hypothetical protein
LGSGEGRRASRAAKEAKSVKKTPKKPAAPKKRLGRPPKNGIARVLGTYLDAGLQADLKEYAREVSADEGAEVSHSDVVARAVKAYRPFRRWKARRDGA